MLNYLEQIIKRLFSRRPRATGNSAAEQEREELKASLRFVIESTHSIDDENIVLQGRVKRGRIDVGQEVELIGFGENMRLSCYAIEQQRRRHDHAWKTDKNPFGLFIRYPDHSIFKPGQVLSAPGSASPVLRFVADVSLSEAYPGSSTPVLERGFECDLHIGEARVYAAIILPDGIDEVTRPAELTVSISLAEQLAVETGEEFKLYKWGAHIGDGTVTGITPIN